MEEVYTPGIKPDLEEEKPEEKPREKPKEFKLPPELHELPQRVEQLGKELVTLKESFEQLVQPLYKLLPPEKEPCPGCGTEIPKEKAEEIKKRLEQQIQVREVVREVPKEVTKEVVKEVPKPEVPEDKVLETIKATYPERPPNPVIEAFERFLAKAKEMGWVK